jgi:hypothetical protein
MPSESPQDSAYATSNVEEVEPTITYVMPPAVPTQLYIPYRGSEFHGVDPGKIPVVEDEDTEGGKVITSGYEPGEEDVNPVPVRIVGTAAHELRQWRAYQITVGETPVMVVNAKTSRSVAHIRQIPTGNVTVWLGPDVNVNPTNGFPLNETDEFTTLTEVAVWARCEAGKATTVCVHSEFTTAE